LKPEILVKKGEVQFLLNKNTEAIASVYQAIKLRPSYDQDYLVLSNYFAEQGDVKYACSILEEGLRHAPENEALKNRLQQLEGLRNNLGGKSKGKK